MSTPGCVAPIAKYVQTFPASEKVPWGPWCQSCLSCLPAWISFTCFESSCIWNYLNYFLQKQLSMWKAEWWKGAERRRGRKREVLSAIFCLTIFSQIICNSWNWIKLKPGAWISYVDCRGRSVWIIVIAFPGTLARSWISSRLARTSAPEISQVVA